MVGANVGHIGGNGGLEVLNVEGGAESADNGEADMCEEWCEMAMMSQEG